MREHAVRKHSARKHSVALLSTLLTALLLALALGAIAAFAQASGPGAPALKLGKPISEADIKAWDIAVLPDGTNLPPGSGTPAQGARIYAEKCVACHAEGGKGGGSPGAGPLVGGEPLTTGIDVTKTIANYYAYATTVFDYIRRAMPYYAPRSLKDDEVYALTAYILSLNKLIGGDDTMDAKTLPQVKMPNRDNFILPYPDRI
jgi:cytochrome c